MGAEQTWVFEAVLGAFLVVVGFVLWWWSRQLVWILIYPPPLSQIVIEALPFVFWGLGVLLIIDSVRRKLKR
ncbi:hypothetical protein KAI12_01975 [Candidatus Bathyarchaeota archaeon]|nr:hypothetical protein [Candidatus Bathyarchaeota archaeon]